MIQCFSLCYSFWYERGTGGRAETRGEIMGRIYIVRHGETEWNKHGRYQGQKIFPYQRKANIKQKES